MGIDTWNTDMAEVAAAMKAASDGHFVRNLEDAEVLQLAHIAVNTWSMIVHRRGGEGS